MITDELKRAICAAIDFEPPYPDTRQVVRFGHHCSLSRQFDNPRNTQAFKQYLQQHGIEYRVDNED